MERRRTSTAGFEGKPFKSMPHFFFPAIEPIIACTCFMLRKRDIPLQRGSGKAGRCRPGASTPFTRSRLRLRLRLHPQRFLPMPFHHPVLIETPFEGISASFNQCKLDSSVAQMYYAIYQMIANMEYNASPRQYAKTSDICVRSQLMNQCIHYFNQGDLELRELPESYR